MKLSGKYFYEYPNNKIVAVLGSAPDGMTGGWRFRPPANCSIPSFKALSQDDFFTKLKAKALLHHVELPADVGQVNQVFLEGVFVSPRALKIRPIYTDAANKKQNPSITFQFHHSIASFTAALESAVKVQAIVSEITKKETAI